MFGLFFMEEVYQGKYGWFNQLILTKDEDITGAHVLHGKLGGRTRHYSLVCMNPVNGRAKCLKLEGKTLFPFGEIEVFGNNLSEETENTSAEFLRMVREEAVRAVKDGRTRQ
jgi:hypothetical protein